MDRAICDCTWRSAFPTATVCVLPATFSNHNPLVIVTKVNEKLSRSLKFEVAWTCDPRSRLTVSNASNSYWHEMSSQQLVGQQNVTKKALGVWNRNHFGNVFSHIFLYPKGVRKGATAGQR